MATFVQQIRKCRKDLEKMLQVEGLKKKDLAWDAKPRAGVTPLVANGANLIHLLDYAMLIATQAEGDRDRVEAAMAFAKGTMAIAERLAKPDTITSDKPDCG